MRRIEEGISRAWHAAHRVIGEPPDPVKPALRSRSMADRRNGRESFARRVRGAVGGGAGAYGGTCVESRGARGVSSAEAAVHQRGSGGARGARTEPHVV